MTDATAADLVKIAAQSHAIFELLNEKINEESGSTYNFSYPNTLLCLCAEVLGTMHSLTTAHAGKQVQCAAWCARNLLELSIWCEYCVRSESNARTFFLDAMRDGLGLVNAIAGIASVLPTGPGHAHLVEAKETFKAAMDSYSMELHDEFKNVNKAAKELGKEQEIRYRYTNIILSKLTHPTAWIVNNHFDDAAKITLVDMSYKIGFALASMSLDELERAAKLPQ